MKSRIFAVVCLIALIVAAGCTRAARLDGSSEEAFSTSFHAVLASLDDEGQEQFKDALGEIVFDKDGEEIVSVLAGKRRGIDLTPDDESRLIGELMQKTGGLTSGEVVALAESAPELKGGELKAFKASLEEVKASLSGEDLRRFKSSLELVILNNGGDALEDLLQRDIPDENQLTGDEKKVKRYFLNKLENRTARQLVVAAQELPRIDGSNRDAFNKSLTRVRNSLNTEMKKRFSEAVGRITFAGTDIETEIPEMVSENPADGADQTTETGDDQNAADEAAEDLWDTVMLRLDGLTGGEVIEMGKGL